MFRSQIFKISLYRVVQRYAPLLLTGGGVTFISCSPTSSLSTWAVVPDTYWDCLSLAAFNKVLAKSSRIITRNMSLSKAYLLQYLTASTYTEGITKYILGFKSGIIIKFTLSNQMHCVYPWDLTTFYSVIFFPVIQLQSRFLEEIEIYIVYNHVCSLADFFFLAFVGALLNFLAPYCSNCRSVGE